ncbi:hypothetical protein RHMOL_Rhmol05G0250300 [Rhododendron molle]|uniref:Uncharacterized protein n=1 Tax=Rhododendron molle TaxID=49168 RepID=A0ACC0NT72_RHOML|nr:hypothetical protein RHMOL_Rhmol05G0250300 [Rhododendron molle]
MVGGRRTRHSHRPTAPPSTTSGAASTSTSGHRRKSQNLLILARPSIGEYNRRHIKDFEHFEEIGNEEKKK